MERHWITGIILAVLTSMSISFGLMYEPLIGVITFLVSVGVWYVVSIVAFRPRGYEEHDDPKPPTKR
jgi:hypothetical protein